MGTADSHTRGKSAQRHLLIESEWRLVGWGTPLRQISQTYGQAQSEESGPVGWRTEGRKERKAGPHGYLISLPIFLEAQ